MLALTGRTVCGPTVSDVCDAPDVCDGVSAPCQPTFATGVVRELRAEWGIPPIQHGESGVQADYVA